MGTILLSGGLAGSGIGVRCVGLLRNLGNADFAITPIYVLMLGLVGGYIVRDSWRKLRGGQLASPKRNRLYAHGFLASLPMQIEFPHSGVQHPAFLPFVLGLLVGLLTAVMGVAGGFMLVPMMVYLLRMPGHVAVGTSLFQALFTCAGATIMQGGANHTVDLTLALLVAVGSTIGAQIGTRLSRLLRGEQLMVLLGILALGVMVRMVSSLIVAPSIPISEVAKLDFVRSIQNVGARFALQAGR